MLLDVYSVLNSTYLNVQKMQCKIKSYKVPTKIDK